MIRKIKLTSNQRLRLECDALYIPNLDETMKKNFIEKNKDVIIYTVVMIIATTAAILLTFLVDINLCNQETT